MLIVTLAAGLLTQFFPCCAFAIRSFSKVSATPDAGRTLERRHPSARGNIVELSFDWLTL